MDIPKDILAPTCAVCDMPLYALSDPITIGGERYALVHRACIEPILANDALDSY